MWRWPVRACGAKRPGRVPGTRRGRKCLVLAEEERSPPSLKRLCKNSVSESKSLGRCERRGHRGSADPRGRALWPSHYAPTQALLTHTWGLYIKIKYNQINITTEKEKFIAVSLQAPILMDRDNFSDEELAILPSSSWNLPLCHSVKNASMVDPQWDILYWGSKWIFITVSWSGVGCEWGTTSVYFGITYVCFILSRLPTFAVEPQYQHRNFLFLSKVSFEEHTKSKKNPVGLKLEWGLQDKYWLSWELLPFEVFFNSLFDVLLGVTSANMLVTTGWSLKHAPHLTSLAWVCVVLELSALWILDGIFPLMFYV